MDKMQLAQHALHALEFLRNALAAGLGVWVMTEIAKRWKKFPLDPENAAKVRRFAGILSGLSATIVSWLAGYVTPADVQHVVAFLTAGADGTITPQILQDFALTQVTFLIAWLSAHATHKTNNAIDAARNKG